MSIKVPAPAGRQYLHVEAEQDHVAVVDGVVLAFLAHLAGFLGGRLAAGGDVVVVADGLRAGEAC